ncbi:hypothetical protein F3Y22_tig00111013pilonHSYRG00139 [Hibiscus syriacus]|uniref:F-box associated beta-propeller type 3 domain-containing protein n=1 Tax=Hibiscus syriacus TaxID=106335 RepID=A0A6A2Z7N7_HIBSY|nr:hypothetical protein F3Y22_tig00111013pilonHSYRG00139 [Hibiscus syriacus]
MRKCRVLSKEVKDLTYESSFMRSHSQRTRTMVAYLIQGSRRVKHFDSLFLSIDNLDIIRKLTPNILYFLSKREPVNILATVYEGLVFCGTTQFGRDQFYICKPSTQQSEIIPVPNRRYFTTKMGMLVLGSNPLRFKIVRLSDSGHDDLEPTPRYFMSDGYYRRYHCEIFDSKSWERKQLDDLMLSYYELFNNKPAVSACGSLYWLTYHAELQNNNVLSFDVDRESWAMTSLPNSLCRNNWHSIDLVTSEGSLGLICISKDLNSVDVWVLRGCFRQIWMKKHTVNLESLNEGTTHARVDSFYNADTLFITGLWTAIFYNFKTGESKSIDLPLNYNDLSRYILFSQIPSLSS